MSCSLLSICIKILSVLSITLSANEFSLTSVVSLHMLAHLYCQNHAELCDAVYVATLLVQPVLYFLNCAS